MMQIKMPELLLIAGTGRNSGKTTLVCHIIKKKCTCFPIVAIKITPHFHQEIESGRIIVERDELIIMEARKTGKNAEHSAPTKESRYRQSMRARGYRLVSMWVPDTRDSAFRAELRRQSRLIAGNESAADGTFGDVAAADIKGWTV